jgi:hypothetical protein
VIGAGAVVAAGVGDGVGDGVGEGDGEGVGMGEGVGVGNVPLPTITVPVISGCALQTNV